MKSAQEMASEMREGGLTDQTIAEMAGLDQGHVTRIRNGDRANVRVTTWDALNTAYLKWKAAPVQPAAR